MNDRSEFGHWEADLVSGSKKEDDNALLTMIERKTREYWMIRRFIPKGKRIDSYSDEQIAQIETWCNSLPRKLLGYRTPDDLFEDELDRIYSCVA